VIGASGLSLKLVTEYGRNKVAELGSRIVSKSGMLHAPSNSAAASNSSLVAGRKIGPLIRPARTPLKRNFASPSRQSQCNCSPPPWQVTLF
jgi:hypothetical protein